MKKLSIEQMENIEGGDYCKTLQMIIYYNELSEGAMEGAIYGYNKAGCSFIFYTI